MTDYLSIIKPIPNNLTAGASYYANTNYVINPSFDMWSAGPVPTGWTASNAPTLTQATSAFVTWRGAYACRIQAAGANKGIYQAIAGTNGQSYRASVYINIVSGAASLTVCDYASSNNPVTVATSGTGWQRLSVTKVAAGGGVTFYILSGGACDFFVDCAQLEDGTTTTTYIDGDQPGCYFNGWGFYGTSTRSDQSREGGAIIALNTLCDGIVDMGGMGFPPFNNVSMPNGLGGGSIHQRTVKQQRLFTVTLALSATTLDSLHSKFKAIEDLLKYDLVTPEQPLKLLYSDLSSATILTIHAVYDAGLEGGVIEGSSTVGVYENVAIRFLADDPCWYDDRQSAQVLGYSQTVANANYILQRKQGVWSALNYGANDKVYCLAYGPDSSLYAGGVFTKVGNVGAADLTVNGIAKWINGTWSVLGATGVSGGTATVYAMTFDAAGNLYIGGSFTAAGGVAGTAYIARWTGSAFEPLGTGTNGVVYALAFDRSGNLYAGGAFLLAGGVANTVRIAKWDGANWTPLSTGSAANVRSLAIGLDNILYVGGDFTLIGGVSCNYIAKWDGTAFTPLGSGIDAASPTIRAIVIGPDGRVYLGGHISSAGGVDCNNITVWNGSTFSPLGSGLNSYLFSMTISNDGTLYAGGVFTSAGGVALPDSVAIWTSSAWLPIDVDFPGTPTTSNAMCFDPRGNLYIGFNDTGSATSAIVTVSANASTKSYPIFKISHYDVTGATATLYQIINYTTGRAIYFNNLQILHGELIWLDLTPGKVSLLSNWRGNLANYILKGSNLDFYIQPGNNNISAYLVGGTADDYIYMLWNNTSWSNNGVA